MPSKSMAAETTESRWFKLVVVIASGLASAFFITNAIYYDRIRNGTCNAISKSEADTMFWINVILAIISVIVFIWGIYRLIASKDYRVYLQEQAVSYATGPGTGFLTVPSTAAAPAATSVTTQ